jgi:hypothetical protein
LRAWKISYFLKLFFNHIFAEFAGIDRTKNSVSAPMGNTAISLLEPYDGQNHIIRCWNDRAHVADILY